MNRLKYKLVPISLIAMGIYLVVFLYVLDWGGSSLIVTVLSLSLIVAGIIFYAMQGVQKRLDRIEEQLEIDKENKINNVALTPSADYTHFFEQIKRTKFVYKASIYLPSANIGTLLFLKIFLDSIQIDSTLRVMINEFDDEKFPIEQFKEMMKDYKNKFENKIEFQVVSNENTNFSIIVLDKKIWILTNFGKEIKNRLLFNVNSYDELGKPFIDLFNSIWCSSNKN